ncbi:MAG: cytochrome c3 family protein [Pyrinomonadaceae bacterium]
MKNYFATTEKSAVITSRCHRQLLSVGLFSLIIIAVTAIFPTAWKTPIEAAVISAHESEKAAQNYGVFSHAVREHAQINCDSCHRRSDNSITPKFAPHAACTDCHLAQFVTPQTQMCLICHADVGSAPAPMRSFPAHFNERFNMKFDHAAHLQGEARPTEGCAACHLPLRRGVALSIPVNQDAHNQCYSCHTPNRVVGGRNIGSCSTCHSLNNYRRTSTGAKAFQASFSHASHSARQKLSCNDCHSVKAEVSQGRQVASPIVAEHFASNRAMSCLNCHNDRRSFGDRDFANCKRCHTGASFQMKR